MKLRVGLPLAFVLLLGCSKASDPASPAPTQCVAYLDCLSEVDPDAFDEEVGVYGDRGTCVEGSTPESCAQACETRLEPYIRLPECGGDPHTPAPGVWGGVCLATGGGTCDFGECNRTQNYCFDPEDPCRGFICGGRARGMCVPVDGQPTCVCEAGFENETFALFCCRTNGSDPLCG